MGGVHHTKKRTIPNTITPQQVLKHLKAQNAKVDIPGPALVVLADHSQQILADPTHPLHSQLSHLKPFSVQRPHTPLKKLSKDALGQIQKESTLNCKESSNPEEHIKIVVATPLEKSSSKKSPIRKIGHIHQEEKEALKRYTSQLMSQLSFLSSKYGLEEVLSSSSKDVREEPEQEEGGLLTAAEGDLDDALLAKLEAAFRDHS